MMRRVTRALSLTSLTCALSLALGLLDPLGMLGQLGQLGQLGIAHARKPTTEQRRTALREAATLELELTTTANQIARGQAALERERESIDWTSDLLARRGREGLRKLDAYRERRVDREALGEVRARELYKLARGGGMLEMMFEDGGHGHVTPLQRRARATSVRRLIDRDLEILKVHSDAEASARDELLTANRELRVVAALESIARVQSDALALTSTTLDDELHSAHDRRKALQKRLRGRSSKAADRKLLYALAHERRDLLRARGLDLLEADTLVRPVGGRVVGRFGQYDDPLLDVPMHRNGVELAAAPNDQVLALAPGEVVLVGALPGFERIVVIDHGGGYLSLTARLLTIGVEQGQEVEAGAVLGRVGPKAVPDGLGTTVYVEIRHGQRPIDPRPYLRN
jgi:murein DD-endopeptidase MepM/ murein hydrolase activator NlpD